MSHDSTLLAQLAGFGKVLNRTLDLTTQHAFERERETEQILGRFQRQPMRSFVLVGPSGSGKTAVLHEVVRQLQQTPRPWLVLETSSSMILAGTRYLGELETRARLLIDAARRPAQVLLYFTDLFALVTAGRSSSSDTSIGTFLSPYIESGELLLAGECTPEQYRAGFERFPAFKKLFDVLRIDEPTPSTAARILSLAAEQKARQASARCGTSVGIPEPVLSRITELADVFFPLQAYPGRTMRLLDHVLDLATGDDRTEGAAPRDSQIVVTPQVVVQALHEFTGIPTLLLDDTQPLEIDEVRRFFESRVLGQPEAIEAMVDLITLMKAGLADPGKPLGVYFFVGPTGVGKTELAKVLAEFIFGSPDRMLRFDMSEYKDYSSFEKLVGNPQARDDSPLQAGSLVARVRQEPFAVILLDEIEKAHANIFDLCLQVFDDGRLTDPLGRTTNFTQTIVIMTSNVGSDVSRDASLGLRPEARQLRDDVDEAMAQNFRPEFLNRIDRVVLFQPLSREHMRRIAHRELDAVLSRSGIVRRNLRIDVDPGVIEILLREGFTKAYGARPLKRAVERLALLPVARQIVKLRDPNGEALLRLSAVADRIKVTLVQLGEPQVEQASVRGVTIVDPVRKKKVRLSLESLPEKAGELRAEIERLQTVCDLPGMRQRKAQLLEQSGQPGFWDEPDQARQTLGEIHRLEKLLDSVERIEKRMTDLECLIERALRLRTSPLAAQAVERLFEVRRHFDVVRYSMHCQGRFDRCDAFVAITLIDDETPPPDDVAGLLADMYSQWARTKGFEASVVHEELLSPETTREIVLLIEGVSVYGVLRGEEGIHEMIYGRTSKEPQSCLFVKVRVLPAPEDEPRWEASDVETRSAGARGEGRRVRRYRSHVTLTHKPTMTSVRGRSGLEASEAAQLLGDLLRAEYLHRQAAVGEGPEAGSDTELIVRRYRLRPTHWLKDQRTGQKVSAPTGQWNAALDRFLHAQLEQRRAPAPQAELNGAPADP